MEKKEKLIELIDNEILFYSLNNPRIVTEFIEIILSKQNDFNRNLILNFKNTSKGSFPNACVPITGLIHDLKSFGFNFEFYYLNDYLKIAGIKDPYLVKNNKDSHKWLDRIWKFEDSSDINVVINKYVDELSQEIVSEKGVLEGLEWSLAEVMDNVLRHSMKNYGFVMGQIHSNQRIAVTVFDTGIGIYNSLIKSDFKPANPRDALLSCLKKGVTRDKKNGQGFGLFGLAQIVRENSGHLMISSNTATYLFDSGTESTFINQPALPTINGTIVDFQITYTKEIPLKQAFGGYEPVNLRMEKLENETGSVIFKIKEQASGTSTRQSGTILRNEVINIYKQTQKSIFLDFEGVKIVSSSFADELIGKLVTEFGFITFNNIIKLINLNPTAEMIVQRSVAQRMNETFNKGD